jgi:hypothetical protein
MRILCHHQLEPVWILEELMPILCCHHPELSGFYSSAHAHTVLPQPEPVWIMVGCMRMLCCHQPEPSGFYCMSMHILCYHQPELSGF